MLLLSSLSSFLFAVRRYGFPFAMMMIASVLFERFDRHKPSPLGYDMRSLTTWVCAHGYYYNLLHKNSPAPLGTGPYTDTSNDKGTIVVPSFSFFSQTKRVVFFWGVFFGSDTTVCLAGCIWAKQGLMVATCEMVKSCWREPQLAMGRLGKNSTPRMHLTWLEFAFASLQ